MSLHMDIIWRWFYSYATNPEALAKYYSGDQIKKNEMGREYGTQDFGVETWGKWLFGRPRRRLEDDTKIDL
jgi:hypothetical protein